MSLIPEPAECVFYLYTQEKKDAPPTLEMDTCLVAAHPEEGCHGCCRGCDPEGFCILGLLRETGKKVLLKDMGRGGNAEKQKKASQVLF